jgi:glycosyltransferase involved in cell wall biosynthesis
VPGFAGAAASPVPETLPPVLQVGLDVSPLALTRAGTARYLASLLSALENEPEVSVRRYSYGGDGRLRKVVRDAAWYPAVLPREARRDGKDVLHCPTQRAPFRSRVPLVVTIHDVAVLRHPEAFNRWTRSYSAFALPRVVRAARHVIVGSEFTRDEVVELLSVPAEKLRVIPYGVGEPFSAEGPASGGDFVLAVSTLEPRKNLDRLIEGFRRADLRGLELRVVGAPGWGGVRVNGEGVRWLTGIGDEELARLYRGAACVAYVSLYEGFGLPVLEAMASGAPVVAPAGPPFGEFAADVAVGVDPHDPSSIAAGLREAVARRSELAPLGRQRAREYTWKRAAKAHVEVYREAAA